MSTFFFLFFLSVLERFHLSFELCERDVFIQADFEVAGDEYEFVREMWSKHVRDHKLRTGNLLFEF